jgi:protein-tyrosine-phosphatase
VAEQGLSARDELAPLATRAWSDARSLLFVCLGNVCRSPFAERLALRQMERPRAATSAGHYPVSGRRAPQLALGAAQRFGVDLASHRSRVLSPRMVEEADAIFVFDQENYEAVVSRHSGAAGRTYLLGALCRDGPVHIADPFGGPASLYETTYRRIADAVAAAEQSGR